MRDVSDRKAWPLSLMRPALIAGALALVGAAEAESSCHDRLVGKWVTSYVTDNVVEDHPEQKVRWVWYLTLAEDGSVEWKRQYEIPDNPGVRAPHTPSDGGDRAIKWDTGLPKNASKADCTLTLIYGSEHPDPVADDVKFDGPDSFALLQEDAFAFKRVVAP